nr:MAG TPA: hypothetical protein [Caudoviricetes sp.]
MHLGSSFRLFPLKRCMWLDRRRMKAVGADS